MMNKNVIAFSGSAFKGMSGGPLFYLNAEK